MFVLGKMVTYVLLAIPFIMGAQTQSIKHWLSHWSEPLLAGFMLICGVVLLFTGNHHHDHDHGVFFQITHEKHLRFLFSTAYHILPLVARNIPKGIFGKFLREGQNPSLLLCLLCPGFCSGDGDYKTLILKIFGMDPSELTSLSRQNAT